MKEGQKQRKFVWQRNWRRIAGTREACPMVSNGWWDTSFGRFVRVGPQVARCAMTWLWLVATCFQFSFFRGKKKSQTKTKTAMYLSRKKRTRKLMLLTTRKTGSRSSNEVPKKQNNTWKNTNYHAGLRYTKGQNGGWHEESSLYLRKDGTKEFLNGNQDLTSSSHQKISRQTKKKMGRRSQRIHKNSGRTW